MARIPGLRRTIFLVAVTVIASAVLWPIGRDLAMKLTASHHRSAKVNFHQRKAEGFAKKAARIIPCPGWDRAYRQMLLDTSSWHTRRAETFKSADDSQLDDEDLNDEIGADQRYRGLKAMLSEQPTSY